MASSSSSTAPQMQYDVFLSFRGEDTRHSFTSHLKAALCRNQIETFMDIELRRGDEISPSLLNAIESSKVSIIIFSERYASSSWCLQELEKILESKKQRGQVVIPVFYQVDPSDVRKLTGSFKDAFVGLEGSFKWNSDMLQGWKTALTEAANLSGFDSKAFKDEAALIEEIIQVVSKILNGMSPSDNSDWVGVGSRIKEIESLLRSKSEVVFAIGIWGIGGIGKTTTALAVYNRIFCQFDAYYLALNVTQESEKNGLTHLREELLYQISKDRNLNLRLAFTRERLSRKKVLLVFDDVISAQQIKDLIGDFKLLGAGSRMIITTRDKQVLENCGVDHIYDVTGLSNHDSLQLLSQYAFKMYHPIEGYRELSNRLVTYVKGVPLALTILGSFLFKKEQQDWESTLNNLEKSLHIDIHKVLKTSYDGLADLEKNIFLDIACFFNGQERNFVEEVLDACYFSSHSGVSTLIDKCLITLSDSNNILMHDLIQNMGRTIVREKSFNPGKHTRLWHHQDIYNMLRKNMGTKNIEGISLNLSCISQTRLNPDAFAKMHNLRFFKVHSSEDSHADEDKLHGFEDLKSFSTKVFIWERCPLKSLPNCDMEDLVRLDLPGSKIEQLFNGFQNPVNLKYINLSGSIHLAEVPNLSKATNIQHLILSDCKSLTCLPDYIQSKYITLRGCSSLTMAPKISCKVEELDLSESAITESPLIEGQSKLVRLDLSHCLKLESISESICKCESLQYLSLASCSNLESLPDYIQSKSIILRGCSSLKMAPKISRKVEELNLSKSAITKSPIIENESDLIKLDLSGCSRLKCLESSITKCKRLKEISISGAVIKFSDSPMTSKIWKLIKLVNEEDRIL